MILVLGAFILSGQQVVGEIGLGMAAAGPARRLPPAHPPRPSPAAPVRTRELVATRLARPRTPARLHESAIPPAAQTAALPDLSRAARPLTSAAMRQASGLRHVFARRRTTQPRGCPCDRARVKPAAAGRLPPMPLGGLQSCGSWGVARAHANRAGLVWQFLILTAAARSRGGQMRLLQANISEFRSITDQTLPVDGLVV